ncbi:MAG: LamG domain-containing protein, partial [Planctomycetes bacterium]|nr:LamG domain-containing protein [Planctomycetota bacterium]
MQKINKVLVVVGLVFGVSAGNAFADLIGYWSFEEGQGTDAADVTGNGNDGVFNGAVEWVDGFKAGGVRFDTTGERIVIGPLDPTAGTNEMTLAAWIKWEGQGHSTAHQGIIGKRLGWSTTGATIKWFWEATPANALLFRADFSGGGTGLWWNNTYLEPHANEWIHVALTWADGVATQYINAGEVSTGNVTFRESANDTPVTIGCVDSTNNETFVGTIDEARIYNEALDEDGLLQAMTGDTTPAVIVGPPNNGPDINRETTLSWMPGEFAATHDVYFGASFDDVSAASRTDPRGVQVSQDQEALSVDTGRLEFDQTYYWRVDEVNGAPDFAVFPGEVWSFTVEAFSIPITNITTTASSSFGLSLAENTINGSGMVDDLHGSSAADMWISGGIPATIEFAFDRVYKLHELWIWNSNQLIESFVGFGAKDVVIEHSLDGANWTVLDGVGPLAQAPGTGGYAHNNTIDFGGLAARQVRITVNSVQGIAPQASLSEVRFYTIPTLATRPDPADGATGVAPDVALRWGRGGRDAALHEVYVGTDADSMTLAESVTDGSLESSSMDLELGQSYTWRVDEVNDTMDPSTWTGDIWSFTTVGSLVIDDMESYRDEEFLEIWATWVDGFDDPTNGSLVGGAAGIPETGIVQGGSQSLPMDYGIGGAAQSEATRTFDQAQDWSRSGIQSLVLYFKRGADNTGGGQVYVKINDTKIVYEGP